MKILRCVPLIINLTRTSFVSLQVNAVLEENIYLRVRFGSLDIVHRLIIYMPKRVMTEKIYTRRKRGRSKVRWLDDVQEDLERWGLKHGEEKLRIGTSGGE